MAASGETRLIIPALAPVYNCLGQFTNPLLRVVFALQVVPPGWAKLTNPKFAAEVAGLVARIGLPAPAAWTWLVAALEFFGGIALALGLLTRPLAAMFIVQMLVIAVGLHWPGGRGMSFDLMYDLLLAALAVAFALRGGGRWSLDRLIGREF